MTEYVFMNGEYVEADKAVLPVRTHAFLYGTSVFEGIRAYYNQEENQMYAFRVKDHYKRLLASAKVMWMESPYNLDEYEQITALFLSINSLLSESHTSFVNIC